MNVLQLFLPKIIKYSEEKMKKKFIGTQRNIKPMAMVVFSAMQAPTTWEQKLMPNA